MPQHRDLSSPVPWRQSLRAARTRRARRQTRRRRLLRGRVGLFCAVGMTSVAAGGALAQGGGATASAPAAAAASGLAAVQQKLGITADGVDGPQTGRAVRRFQRAHGLAVDGVVGPQTRAALGVAATTAAPRSTTGTSTPASGTTGVLVRIARCESGGNPAAISKSGVYRGKYQFDRATWRRLGGTGDPAQAAEAEQDRRALALYRQRGTAPWPVCG